MLRGLWRSYEQQLAAHPMRTQMATSCLLWAAGDVLAQRVEHFEQQRYGSSSSHESPQPSSGHTRASNAHLPAADTSAAPQQQHQQLQSSSNAPHAKPFSIDQRRMLLTAFGFGALFVGPVGETWYSGLEKVCRQLVPSGGVRFLATKVVADSAVMGSVYVAAFFAFSSLAIEGSGWQGFVKKMKVDFLPTYAAELAVWPLFQAVNFSQVPVRHQLLAVNTFSLLDAAFISWCGNQQDWFGKIMHRLGMADNRSKQD